MFRVRICTSRWRCQSSCRRSRFSGLGTQIRGKRSSSSNFNGSRASSRSANAVHRSGMLPARKGSALPNWQPQESAPCGSGESIPLLLPPHPSRGLPPGCRTPTGNPMRSESHESHGLSSLVPSQNRLHLTLKVVIPQDSKYSTEIEKRSFMRFQKRLLARVREGAMERSSTGHAAHAKYVGQLPLSADICVSFIPVHLRFFAP